MIRRAFTLIELLVVIAIVSVLVAMLLPAVQAAREAARRTTCRNQVKQQVVAIHMFTDREGVLPSGGMLTDRKERDGAGWRVQTLPYLEEAALFDEIRVEPDGQMTNKDFPTPGVFVCPSSPNQSAAARGWCHYAGVSGSGQFEQDVWDLQDAAFLSGEVFVDGVLYPGSEVAFRQITDGLSQTLAIGERAYMTENEVTKWIIGAVWDGSSSRIKDILMKSSKNVRFPFNGDPTLFGYHGNDPQSPSFAASTLKNNDLYFGSHHPGGAHFAMVDGSVQFLGDDLDFNLYQDMASRSGGEVRGHVGGETQDP